MNVRNIGDRRELGDVAFEYHGDAIGLMSTIDYHGLGRVYRNDPEADQSIVHEHQFTVDWFQSVFFENPDWILAHIPADTPEEWRAAYLELVGSVKAEW